MVAGSNPDLVKLCLRNTEHLDRVALLGVLVNTISGGWPFEFEHVVVQKAFTEFLPPPPHPRLPFSLGNRKQTLHSHTDSL